MHARKYVARYQCRHTPSLPVILSWHVTLYLCKHTAFLTRLTASNILLPAVHAWTDLLATMLMTP